MLVQIKAVSLPTRARTLNDHGVNHLAPILDFRGAPNPSGIGTEQFLLRSHRMARGFESKSVESQQEEAQRARSIKPALSAEEKLRQSRKATLELALAQTQSEMTAACKPAHREMLKLKLEAIQAQLRDL
jgi:hypothetical protein